MQTEGKKSRSEKRVSTKQLIEESDAGDEVISNVGYNNSTDNLPELDDEMETKSFTYFREDIGPLQHL